MDKKRIGVLIIIASSLCTSFGQMFWKLSGTELNLYLFIGFVLYGTGAVLLVLALSFDELSSLHPLLCLSYIFAIILGYAVLGEHISALKIIGISVIIVGVMFIVRKKNA